MTGVDHMDAGSAGVLRLDRAGEDVHVRFEVRGRDPNGDLHVAFVAGQASPAFLRFVTAKTGAAKAGATEKEQLSAA